VFVSLRTRALLLHDAETAFHDSVRTAVEALDTKLCGVATAKPTGSIQ